MTKLNLPPFPSFKGGITRAVNNIRRTAEGREEIYKELDMGRNMEKQDTERGSGQFDKIYLLLTMLPWDGRKEKTGDG